MITIDIVYIPEDTLLTYCTFRQLHKEMVFNFFSNIFHNFHKKKKAMYTGVRGEAPYFLADKCNFSGDRTTFLGRNILLVR